MIIFRHNQSQRRGMCMYAEMTKRAALLPLLLMLCQCDKVQAVMKPKPAGPTPYDFTLALEFTPAAIAKMESRRDKIVITTFYYGHAKPEYMAKADDLNRLELGYKEWEVSNTARKVAINSSIIDTQRLPHTTEGEPYVLVTVTSEPGPQTTAQVEQGPHLRLLPSSASSQAQELPDPEIDHPGDRIECRTYTGPVKALQTQPHILSCDLGTP